MPPFFVATTGTPHAIASSVAIEKDSANSEGTTARSHACQNSGIAWRSYQESISGTTCPLTASGQYAPKHNPMVYFDDVTNTNNANSANCIAHVKPYTQLATDLNGNSVARYNFITPNLCDDMHGATGCPADLIAAGDTWLSQNVPTILNSSAYKNGGVLFIVWDEGSTSAGCCTDAAGGHIPLLVISPLGKPAFKSTTPETHYSLLRTIEDSWSLPRLNGAGCTCSVAMREYFK